MGTVSDDLVEHVDADRAPGDVAADHPSDESAAPAAGRPRPSRSRRGRLELRVELNTLLGLDDHPATLAGWGAVDADTGRRLARTLHHGEWRLALCDADGDLMHAALLRRRPSRVAPAGIGSAPASPGAHPVRGAGSVAARGSVELAAPVHDLVALDPADPRWVTSWGPVLAELQDEVRRWAAALPVADPDPRAAGAVMCLGPREIHRRLADAATARWVRGRDRECPHPACRQPASRNDIDHTRPWAELGRTVPSNLSAPCLWHHTLRHRGGWRLYQPRPGHLHWCSRAGAVYDTRPPPIINPYEAAVTRQDRGTTPLIGAARAVARTHDELDDPTWTNAPIRAPQPAEPLPDPPPF